MTASYVCGKLSEVLADIPPYGPALSAAFSVASSIINWYMDVPREPTALEKLEERLNKKIDKL